jgi:WD40 repeat protein
MLEVTKNLCLILSLCCLPLLAAEDATLTSIRLLRDECLSCHKPGKSKGGLMLNSRAALLKGGDSGPSISPGKAEDSVLYQVLLKDGDPHMPPKKQLPSTALAAMKQWLDSGAEWKAEVLDEPPAIQPVELGTLPTRHQPALAMALSPDEKKLAVTRGGSVLIYDLSQAERPLEQKLDAHRDTLQSVAWSPDGAWLATASFRSIKVWEVGAWREIKHLQSGLLGPITALCLTSDHLFAADGIATQSGFLHRIDYLAGRILSSHRVHEDSIYALALAPDGKSLATGSADKMIRLWTVPELSPLGACEGHVGQVTGLAYDRKGGMLGSTSADKETKVWEVKSRQQVVLLGDKKEPASAIAWSADGSTLVTATEKGRLQQFTELQPHTGSERSDAAKSKKLPALDSPIHALAISRDGKTIFASTASGLVQVWSEQKLLGPLKEP